VAATQLIIPDPSLILLIGPAGAGKSTFAARHFGPTEIVSSDRCRAMIADDESDQGVTAAAFSLLHHIARARLEVGRLTVIDATNLQFTARRPLLRMARFFHVPAVAIVLDVSLETCLARNLTRSSRRVNEEVIGQHSQELSSTISRLRHEGYARIYVLSEREIDGVTTVRTGRAPDSQRPAGLER